MTLKRFDVEGEYTDYTPFREVKRISLNADQAIFYQTWTAPIKWSGFVGGIKVEFIQINDPAYDEEDFDWTGFPTNLHKAIPAIIKAIDEAMREMD